MLTDLGYENEQLAVLTSPDIGAGSGEVETTGEPQYAGLDKDLSGVTIRMANIGGQPYEAMYDSISKFEEETGATVEIVFLGDGFEIDRYLKTNYAAGTEDFDVAWNHTSFMAQYTNFVEPLQDWFTKKSWQPLARRSSKRPRLTATCSSSHAMPISAVCITAPTSSRMPICRRRFEAAYGYPAGTADHAG